MTRKSEEMSHGLQMLTEGGGKNCGTMPHLLPFLDEQWMGGMAATQQLNWPKVDQIMRQK